MLLKIIVFFEMQLSIKKLEDLFFNAVSSFVQFLEVTVYFSALTLNSRCPDALESSPRFVFHRKSLAPTPELGSW